MDLSIISDIVQAVAYFVAGATIISRITPTQKDDKLVEKARKFLEKVSNLFLPDIKLK